jgi:putative transcriptional regulator
MRLVGDAVREARRDRGLTQDDLAHAAGTTQDRISEIEAGRGNPHLLTLARIAGALDMTLVIPKPHCLDAMESSVRAA